MGCHNIFAELPDDPPSFDHVRLTVEIQVETDGQQLLDVAHIAYQPMAVAELEMVVYNKLDRMNPMAVIQLSDGLGHRTFCNSPGQEKATLDKLGHGTVNLEQKIWYWKPRKIWLDPIFFGTVQISLAISIIEEKWGYKLQKITQ